VKEAVNETTSALRPYRSPSVGCYTRQHCSLFLPPTSLFSSTRTMSQTHAHPSASSSSSFQPILEAALEAYEKKTKTKLLDHSLAAQLQSCASPTAILSVLQDLIQQFDHRRRSDDRLSSWLSPTVNVLYAFSSTIGQGVGLVSLNWPSSWNL
jgi:hypothetical protein